MSWKQWIVALSTVVLTTQFTPANADYCDSSRDCGFNFCDCDPCEGWSIYADYLYWRVRNCDLDYAVKFDPTTGYTTKLYEVDPSYDSGFRVGLLKACNDMDFAIHYTYFKSKDRDHAYDSDGHLGRTRLSDPAFTTNGDIQYASGGYKVQLNQIDVEAGYHTELTDCFASRLFGGFRYANIKQHLVSHYEEDHTAPTSNPEDYVYQSSDMDFYGLYLGAKTSYNICDCFDVFGGLSLGLGVGDFDRSYKGKGSVHAVDASSSTSSHPTYTETSHISNDCWRSVGVLDLNVGITFPLCNVCCTDWALSFGYEFHHWFNTGGFLTYNEERDPNTVGETTTIHSLMHVDHHASDVGFDGLFVRLSAAF